MATPNTTKKTGRGWAYTGALLGGTVSIAANVAHSYVPPDDASPGWHPHAGAVVGAVFWPLALFVAVEIFARIAWPTGQRWTALRFLGLLPVALVAAVVSYRHLSGLLAFYREDALTATIGPLAVDGLMVMATGALIATGARRAAIEIARIVEDVASGVTQQARSVVSQPVQAEVSPGGVAPQPVLVAEDEAAKHFTEVEHPDVSGSNPAPGPTSKTSGKAGRGKQTTATAVARLRDKYPDMTTAEIAKRLKVTDRTVRRYLNARAPQPPADPTPLAA